MNDQTKDALAGNLRVILGAAAGFATAKGYLNYDTATAVVGLTSTLIPMAWSWWAARKREEKVQERVEAAANGPREEWSPEQRAQETGAGG